MKDRKKSDIVGHSGPRTSPIPCHTRNAPTIPSHPTIATARIRVTSQDIFVHPSQMLPPAPRGNDGWVDPRRRGNGAPWDAALYAASSFTALAVLWTSDGPLDLLWARVAAVGYGLGAVAAWLLARRGMGIRGRTILAAVVFAVVAVVPTIVLAGARAGSPTAHVKSDVLVVEQAAASLLDGRNPYAAEHDDGPLAAWPGWAREHFPYLAATVAAGAARALAGPAPWTDPRLLYLALALAVAGPSIRWSGAPAERRLRAILVLFVLATGAPLVVTSGKEILVLGLLAASLVALQRGHPALSGAAAGIATAMHQLAWLVLPIYAFMPTRTGGRRVAAIAASIAVSAVVPFLVWDAGAFVEDAVLFPLGFGQPDDTSAFTPGGLLTGVVPGSRSLLIAVTVLAAGVVIAVAILRGVRTPSDVARWTGTLLLVVLVLAPRVRLAYLALPVNLLLWSQLLRDDRSRQSPRREAGRRWRWPLAAFAHAETALPSSSSGTVARVKSPGEIDRSSSGRTGNETVPSARPRGE